MFHKFDLLDNYTDHMWFLNLSISNLKSLYKICKEIWDFKCNIRANEKKKIVKDGKAFRISLQYIYRLNQSSKRELQNIILDEFLRFATEGINLEEKKLGSLLMLTGLVQVSNSAAMALPYLLNTYY